MVNSALEEVRESRQIKYESGCSFKMYCKKNVRTYLN